MLKNPVVKKLLYSLLLGLALGAVVSEVPFLFLRETARPPKEITLIIPAGTAEKIAHGQQPPGIPENMVFVVGDTLIVKNEDTVDHKFGPLWIPASTSAQLSLNQEENLAYECTFQPSKYIGLDVRESLTVGTRIYGIIYAGLPLGILIALYSLVIPAKKIEHASA